MRPTIATSKLACAALVSTFISLGATSAQAVSVLVFGQAGGGAGVIATANGGETQTTLSATNLSVFVTQIAGGPAPPFAAFFNFAATSTNPVSGSFEQNFSGNFTITSGLGGTGTNYLSGSFTDLVSGAGSALTLSASTPGDTVNFTSDVMGAFAFPLALALSFSNVIPTVGACGTTLCGFSASVAGTFSAESVPDVPIPGALPLFVSGLGALGVMAWRKKRKAVAA